MLIKDLDYNDSDDLWLIIVSVQDEVLFYGPVNFMYAKEIYGNYSVLAHNISTPDRYIKATYKVDFI